MSDYNRISKCLACGSIELLPLLNLGNQPLANAYSHKKEYEETKYPLATNYCSKCFHVQLNDQVNPELMFSDYPYVSGTSSQLLNFFIWVGNNYGFKKDCDVLDIGCNDGSMLDVWNRVSSNIRTYGVDPAKNIVDIAKKKGHSIHCGFFDGTEFPNKKFEIITCFNAFAHNPNPLKLLLRVRSILANDGYFICSTSQANMIQNGEFDTIYHEHTSFFNILSMKALVQRAGMELVHYNTHPVHGTSRIFVIRHYGLASHRPISFFECLNKEKELYLRDTYDSFVDKSIANISDWRKNIGHFENSNIPIIGYTASARGNTYLNTVAKGPRMIFEDNELKQNMFSPGLKIPVIKPDFTLLDKYPSVLWTILAWPLFDDIKNKIKQERKGRNDFFIRNFPKVEITI